MKIYGYLEILAVYPNPTHPEHVTVEDPLVAGRIIDVLLPSIISRLPAVGDEIRCIVDEDNPTTGLFFKYEEEPPVVPASGTHVHQLLADDIVDNMALNTAQKADMRTKRTGGVK